MRRILFHNGSSCLSQPAHSESRSDLMALVMLRKDYWDRLSRTSHEFWIKVVRIHEVVLFLSILIVLALILPFFHFSSKLAVPTVVNETFQTVGMNPLYGYPIRLNSHTCWPVDLNRCLQENPTLPDPCCTALFDEDATVDESISDLELELIVSLVSIFYLVLRCGLWSAYIYSRQVNQDHIQLPHDRVDKRFWLKVFFDSLMSLGISVIMAYITTEYVKAAVAAPRPNYYALQLFTSVHHSERSKLQGALLNPVTQFSCPRCYLIII